MSFRTRGLIATIFAGVLAGTLTACAPVQPAKPVESAADATASYITAKRAYVEALERAIRQSDPAGSPYRLVAVTGPFWRVGEAVDIDNPLNPITDKCLVASDSLPKPPISWAELPGLTQSRKVDFSAGLPESVLKVLGKDNTLGLKFDLSRTGQFSLSSLQSTILPQDTFEKSLSSECKDILALRGGLVVRGIVSGKEVFKSGGTLSTGANLKLLETELIKVQYDNKGDFELEDKDPTPKMFMVAYFPKQNRGSENIVSRPPTSEEVGRLESLRIK